MNWIDKLNEWKLGKYQTYPIRIKNRFFYECSSCDKDFKNQYNEEYIESSLLNRLTEDYSSFQEHINISNNKYVTSFLNLSGDTLLIIPIPIKDKNYTTIKDFIDNAPIKQQEEFWKFAAFEIERIIDKKVWISTSGLGVSYFHLRICKSPKYFNTIRFK